MSKSKLVNTPFNPSKNHAPRITGLFFTLLMSVICFPVFAQTASATSWEKEFEDLRIQRDKEKAQVLAPIQTRFESAAQELFRTTMQAGNLEAANALKAMLKSPPQDKTWKSRQESQLMGMMVRRDKEIALAVNPIQKRFELATQQLLLKAMQTGDLESANKLKAMIETAGGAAGSVEKNMVRVEGGALPSGSGLAGQVVATFQIGKYEVTWGEWQKVRVWAVANGYDLKDVGQGLSESHPVTDVNWYDVVKWCNAKSEKEGKTPVYQVSGTTYKTGQTVPTVSESANGYRLPSDKEWEWAARGGKNSKGYTYAGSNDVFSVGWFKGNSEGKTHEVGGKLANELEIYDMSGNVWEWCFDLAGASDRRIRGGGWDSGAGATVADRGISVADPDLRGYDFGFRLARSSGN
jgi:formylglycine-generating enzyme required for sulfatase activity